MVKRVKEKHSSQIDKSNENENNSRLLSAPSSKSKPNDDLIVSLSDAYENKRARQVVEWEELGKRKAQPTL
jgi:hypothetical protein